MTSQGGKVHDARELLSTRSDSIREGNKRKVIRAVMAQPATQVQIARRTELSQGTVSGVVQELEEQRVFRVDGGEGERGKRIRIGSVRGVAVGVEVGHDRLTVAVRRVDSEDMVHSVVNFGAAQGLDTWLRECVSMIKDLVAQTGLGDEHIVSIGLGIPAAIDPRNAEISQVASSQDWDLKGHPKEWFAHEFPRVPVIPDNECNFAAYGEHLYGLGRDVEVLLFVKSSAGIGAGLIIGDYIIRGRHGLAGEIGHLTMDPLGVVCRCGSRGCLETLVGGARLVEQVRLAYAGYRVDLPSSLENLIERAKTGDRVCRRIVEDAARNIGLALARVSNIVNPELIVVGGELGRAGDLVIGPATQTFQQNALEGMFSHPAPTTIKQSDLGMLAGVQGALGYALMVDFKPS
ncbi:ROK family transcriptional regulator [Lentzea sp. NBRC 105346]|uniref:ROK family transcriptional regulator n=1 Tax=Lentzea sp. NBRC 105346 TaxID=3032205 RepID=UPI0025576744|nr:ROK family transcriptional regulator [Lentzea sp. NBRC 105346]